jgi:anti-anti-sigma regulatory factor
MANSTIGEWLKVDETRFVQSLQEAEDKLHQSEGEVLLDFTSVIRVDSKGLRELERLADRADAKSSKFVLRGVNVNIYKVLKLMKLSPRFLFRA